MSITAEEVKKLAALSRIKLSPEEIEPLQKEMGAILAYVEEINSAHPDVAAADLPERRNVWCEDADANQPGAYTEKLLANVPAREGQYVKVKKIL